MRIDESIEKFETINGFPFSDEQRAIVSSDDGMVVMACAGSGKTTVMANLGARRILERKIPLASKLLITTFSKEASMNIKTRIDTILREAGSAQTVSVKTLHSYFLSVLKKLRYPSTIISESVRYKMLSNVVREAIRDVEEDTIRDISTLISYQINEMLTDDALFGSHVYKSELPKHLFTAVRDKFRKNKEIQGFVDYDDLQLALYGYIKNNEDYRQYCAGLYSHYFIDEFQDINTIQFRILKKILSCYENPSERLCVVGDPDQCIYEWRGANPKIILNIGGFYSLKTFTLSTNYRSAKEIVDCAGRVIKNNVTRFNMEMRHNRQESSKTEIYVGDSNMESDIVNKIIDYKREEGERGSTAILCRNNMHGVVIGARLKEKGIKCRINDRMLLKSVDVYFDIKKILKLTLNKDSMDAGDLKRVMWKFVSRFGARKSEMLASIMRHDGKSFTEALKAYIDYESDSCSFGYQDDQLRDMRLLLDVLCMEAGIVKFRRLFKTYEMVSRQFLYKSDEKYRLLLGLYKFIEDMLLDRGVEEVIYDLEMIDMDMESSIDEAESIEGDVILTTMHDAKGREWDNVIIAYCDSLSMPSLIRVKELAELNRIAYIEEERRLFYVAITRAKRNLSIFTTSGSISPFVFEMLGRPLKMSLGDIVDSGDGIYREISEKFEKLVLNGNKHIILENRVSATSE